MENKKIFRRLGFGLVLAILAIIIVQGIISGVISVLTPGFVETQAYVWILLTVPVYFVGLPVFWLTTKKIPSYESEERKDLKIIEVVMLFLISMAATYIFNILGLSINTLISYFKQSEVVNPLNELLNNKNILLTALFVGVISPIVEEIIFRKIIIDKVRNYGDRTAIYFSALAFGLFHGNFSQFFYAYVLGLIFGYVTVKTNTIVYSVVLHILINLTGSVILPTLALSGNESLMGIAGSLVSVFLISGIILFFKYRKRINVVKSENEKESNKKMVYFNFGMILYYAVCTFMFLSVIFTNVE